VLGLARRVRVRVREVLVSIFHRETVVVVWKGFGRRGAS